jgi:hypothetical protein
MIGKVNSNWKKQNNNRKKWFLVVIKAEASQVNK